MSERLTSTEATWADRNQRYLLERLDAIKSALEKRLGKGKTEPRTAEPAAEWWDPKTPPPAIDNLRSLFGLSEFETSILLLCAGVELHPEIANLCVMLNGQGSDRSAHATFGLALSVFTSAHWSALSPGAPLRRFHLIEVMASPSHPLTLTPIRVEERVLHYLTGVAYFEPQLNGLFRPVLDDPSVVPSHELLVERMLVSWRGGHAKVPLVQLWGLDEASKLAVARAACSKMGLDLWRTDGELLPQRTDELERFAGLWTREAALLASGLYIAAEETERAAQVSITHFADMVPGPVFLGTKDPWSSLDPSRTLSLEVRKPEREEQRELWRTSLTSILKMPDEKEISRLSGQFNLNAQSIRAAVDQASLLATSEASEVYKFLWKASLAVSRPRLSELAQQIVPRARMEDLVIPDQQRRLLTEISIHAAQRQKVYEEWGFGEASGRGLGITTLFHGASGTGKTMAAEVLANELGLDLFRIDIATVVSKYIGETEKNLRKIFDAAEDGGAILFFDEADALFGKRSEVRDSHDRYANIEVSYLLQRMESYRGLAILSTNMKAALDPAFTRRIRFVVEFPFPDAKSRAEIWRRVFPSKTPLESLDPNRLARLNIAGGTIRDIALYASFLAADEGVPVGMRHIKRAAQVEYDKLERPLTQTELGD